MEDEKDWARASNAIIPSVEGYSEESLMKMAAAEGEEFLNREAMSFEPMRLVLQENARLSAILYSIFKRHPDVKDWSLVLHEIGEDVPPDPLVVGWNTFGTSAIITLVFGETRQAMIEAGGKNES